MLNDQPKQCEGCRGRIHGHHAVGRGGFWHLECYPEKNRAWNN